MTKRWQSWVLSVIGAACVVLVGVNMVLYSRNQALQNNVNRQNEYLQQSVQLQALYRQIVQAVTTLSVRNNDPKLQALLTEQGIRITTKGSPPSNTGLSPKDTKARGDGRTGVTHRE